jgi:tRNA(fMet)-specific endonuclease VapC
MFRLTHVLDANAWVDYFRGKHAALTARVHRCAPGDLAMCSIVLSELYYGANRADPRYLAKHHSEVYTEEIARPALPFDHAAAVEYGRIRDDLTRRGLVIGSNDMLIAANARAHCLILVTNNVREFGRVPGLVVEDWTVP